jgi:predicted dienelactone hydrolase
MGQYGLYPPIDPLIRIKQKGWKMSRTLLIIGIVALVLLAVLLVSVTVPFGTGTARSAPPPDALTYAARGPHPVGMRALATDGDEPLDMTVWYPAADAGNRRAGITYPYTFGMVAPFGAIRVATYAGQASPDAPPDLAAGPYPLVVLSPGLSVRAPAYAWQAEHLASYGFVVIAPEHQEQLDGELSALWQSPVTRPGEVLDVLATVDGQVGAGGALDGLVDPETVAVIGHSYGGYTALAAGGARIDTDSLTAHCDEAVASNHPSAWLCEKITPHMADMAALAGLDAVPDGLWPAWADPRVDAVVPMAGDAFFFGQPGLAEIAVPVMAIGGTADEDSPYTWGTYPTYEYASSPAKVRIALEGAQHMIFTGPCEAVPLLMRLRLVSGEFCADPGWDRYYAHDLVNHFTTAFLLAELKGDADAAAALAPDAVGFDGMTYEAQGY